jgi:hypothetical protein
MTTSLHLRSFTNYPGRVAWLSILLVISHLSMSTDGLLRRRSGSFLIFGVPSSSQQILIESLSYRFGKAIAIIPLPEGPYVAKSPIEIPLEKGGEAFWLNNLTLAIVVNGTLEDNNQAESPGTASERDLQHIYAIFLQMEDAKITFSFHGTPVGRFPPGTNATNFVYNPKTSNLIFTAYAHPNQDLMTIKQQDEVHAQREDSAMVFDGTYTRNWDTWTGPTRSTIFSVWLGVVPGYKNVQAEWKMGSVFECPLRGLGHVGRLYSLLRSFLIFYCMDSILPWNRSATVVTFPFRRVTLSIQPRIQSSLKPCILARMHVLFILHKELWY